jgi:hypothetical protein
LALIKLNPKSSLNKAFLKVKPNRVEIEKFKSNLISLLDNINETESEEFHKNLISEFLKKTYYDPSYYINTKGRNDLVIHNGKEAKDSVAVIIEAKKPTNKAEMLKQENINTKAFQELVLYFLRERITHKNYEIKCLVATNINEWFIFDATVFEKNFAQNKALVTKFNDFVDGRLSGDTTDFFYKEIAQPAIAAITSDIEFTYFDIREYDKPLRNENKQDDNKLISLFKLLSPEHLLKLPFINDSNNLDKKFYSELLHIIGLVENKEGSKKLIQRKKKDERDSGSLLENAIDQIDSLDKLNRFDNPTKYGANKEERLFNVGLELVITWINRILFLKLLEAQLLTYHKSDVTFSFLNQIKITNFDDLNSLFFQVLARKSNDRNSDAKKLFAKVPFLNSSLFEPTDIEHTALFISNLRDDKKIPVLSSTVLKDSNGNKFRGELSTLEYLFKFLDAYDFASEGAEEIQEENKSLINASVLGLIFEKINGYKDGSFFTPGFITMYMSRETIRRAVVQKFNEVKGWKCVTIAEVYEQRGTSIKDRKEANAIINSIKICDPAVGSGHFLVSALNEIIAIKSDLKVLLDREDVSLNKYAVEVVNDELIITDEDGGFFEYKPFNPESQRIQEALFHEKQTIIENCLFGVDINPNSVKICRLRLWIELLKNAYYKNTNELETLPNIDINIKCGNSLISRFGLDSDLKQALKKSKSSIKNYKSAVDTYRNASNKEQKRDMEKLIEDIKNNFRLEIYGNDPKVRKLEKLKNELGYILGQSSLFDETTKEKKVRKEKLKELELGISKLNSEIQEIKANKIYENAFEWRFEFPEVLNDDGDYEGFDVLIGNPPYGVSIKDLERTHLIESVGKVPDFEIYYLFINRSNQILRKSGFVSLIIPNSIIFNVYAKAYRINLFDSWEINEVLDCTDFDIFADATVRNVILSLKKEPGYDSVGYRNTDQVSSFHELAAKPLIFVDKPVVEFNNQNWGLLFKLSPEILNLVSKIKSISKPLNDFFPETSQGLIAYDKYQGQSKETIKSRKYHSNKKKNESFKPWLYGEDVTRYSVDWNGAEYINYCDGIANPRNPKFFKGERLLIREITSPTIYAAYTNDELYFDPSILVVLNNSESKITILSLLGILNSKLATFYHFNSSPKATKGAFPKILVNDINNFPLPENPDYETLISLEKLVNEVSETDKSKIHVLDQEINKLVYKLYKLEMPEIKIIESKF